MTSYFDDDSVMLDQNDVLLNSFYAIKERYPNLVFTNIDATNKVQRRAVYIYPNDYPRHGNVFIELWRLRNPSSFTFFLKKSIMTEDEKAESARLYKKDNSQRGAVTRCMTYRKELLDYIIPKLDMIEAAK